MSFASPQNNESVIPASTHQAAGAIQDWLKVQLAARLHIEPDQIDVREPFSRYGLSSREAVVLSGDLERWLGRQLSPTVAWDYPNIEALARYLSGEATATVSAPQSGAKTCREPIAIIGMGCRFPGGANDLQTFWRLLRDGIDAISPVPADRWDVDAFYDPDPDAPGKMYTCWGGFLAEGVDKFDPHFFRISRREAISMDPQQRLLLEVSWEALENAGQAPHKLAGSQTGVFIGICSGDYGNLQMQSGDVTDIDFYTGTGIFPSVASGRLSYILGLQGPNLAIDTACSSSLVAIHLACQSLVAGECSLALAGGVSVILAPDWHIYFSKIRVMAADGRCKAFDAAADGYVRGEGCGILVLKRLSDALADGDNILAVVQGSAINHDGSSNGLTAPNGLAQQAVIHKALENAGIEPHQLSYVEAHGTGTAVGDPIEVQSLSEALGSRRPVDLPLMLGSVKTNIGHLEAAAGVASVIKVVLALQHKEIPPQLHLKKVNPLITLDKIPAVIPTRRTPWLSNDPLRFAGVSSFGISGTNAHVILAEAPPPSVEQPVESVVPSQPCLLPLSAHKPEALRSLALAYESMLTAESVSLRDVCYTASVRRKHHDHRLALQGDSREELQGQLQAFMRGEKLPGWSAGVQTQGQSRKLTFVFSGQGSQWLGMGRELLQQEPVFRDLLSQCDRVMRRYVDWSLLDELAADAGRSRMDEIDFIQPALCAIQIALATLWQSWGIRPDAVAGHSMGEVAAACVAGILSLEDAMRVICHRGRVLGQMRGLGAMAVVDLSVEQTQQALVGYEGRLAMAASNGPASTVISGEPAAIEQVLAALQSRDVFCRLVKVDIASHSPQMAPLADELFQCLEGLQPQPARIPFYSTVTGAAISSDSRLDAEYWARNLRQPVLFSTVVQQLLASDHDIFLEISPHPILLSAVQQWFHQLQRTGVTLPSLRREKGERHTLFESLSVLYALGRSVEWERLYPSGGRCVALPTFPWQRERCWLEKVKIRHSGRPSERRAAWEAAVAAGSRQARQWPVELNLENQSERSSVLDRLTTAYVSSALQKLGIYAQAGERHSAATLSSQFSLLPLYQKLLRGWLKRLAAAGLLEQEKEFFVSLHPLPTQNLDALWTEVKAVCTDTQRFFQYLRDCGEHLASVLVGEYSPLDLLFPGGAFDTAETLYQYSPEAQYFNGIAQAIVRAAAKQQSHMQPLRIVEIGAGTGGTTASLLPALAAQPAEYTFTDISNLFLNRARLKFQDYGFVRYGLLNIETSPQDQGYAAQSFDVVVAANVLHATRDLGETLEHVRSLLAPGGLLVIWEVTHPQAWFDISFGLIEGWQRYADEWRQDCPLLSQEKWQAVLRAHGFADVSAFPEPGSEAEALEQHIVLARMPATAIRSRQKGDPHTEPNVVSHYYDLLSQAPAGGPGEGGSKSEGVYLTFGPFPEIVPGFSWLLAFRDAQNYPDYARLANRAQQELRDILFRHVDFAAVNKVLDFGCGYATDLITLAEKHDHLQLHGYTISAAQAEIGNQTASAHHLQERVQVFHADSGKTEFPDQYEMIFGFEVAGHVEDKSALFSNVTRHIQESGWLLLADFVANGASAIQQAETGAYTITAAEWAQVLAQNELSISECVDISRQVSNFLYDPDFQEHLEAISAADGLEQDVKRTLLSYENIGKALRKNLLSYVLLSVQKTSSLTPVELERINLEKLESPLPYSAVATPGDWLPAGMLARPDETLKDLDRWLYTLQWQPKEHSAEEPLPQAQPGVWLILADQNGLGQTLASLLTAQAERCVLVFPGEAYERLDQERFHIRPAHLQDLQRLLTEAVGPDLAACRGLVHLWSLDAPSPEKTSVALLKEAQTFGCGQVLLLAQELARVEEKLATRLWLVTAGAQAVKNSEPVSFAQAPLWGLGRVIATEYPELWGGLIDLEPGACSEAARLIWQEISRPDGENQIAFRRGERHVARLERAAARPAHSLRWRADGTYLITGGRGALGLLAARWMVRQGARRLILLGRGDLGPRSTWKQVDPNSDVGKQIAAVCELESLGASVHLASVDVADETQLVAFLETFEQECWPPIRGIIHAAGLVEGQTLVHLDLAALNAVLRPKVVGGWLLHRFFADAPLDFFVLFSSASALMGPPGQGNYAAANAFLDALAHYRQSQGLPALSVDWGPWTEVGRAAKSIAERLEIQGMERITPERGLTTLGRLIGQDSAQVGVFSADWQQWRQSFPALAQSPLLTSLFQEATELPQQPGHPLEAERLTPEALAGLEPEAARQALVTYLRQQVAKTVGMPAAQLDVQQPLNLLGMDSLMAVEIKNRLETDLKVVIPMVKFLGGANIVQLADEVASRLGSTTSHLAGSDQPAVLPDRDSLDAAKQSDPISARQLLSKLDDLSAQEVDELLGDLLAEQEDVEGDAPPPPKTV